MSQSCDSHQLDRYLDGELGRARRTRVEQHLAACPACRGRLEALKFQGELLRDELGTATDAIDFAGFEDRVMARIHSETPPSFAERATVWLREVAYHYRAVWVTSLATALFVVVVLLPLLSTGPASESDHPDKAAPPSTPQVAEAQVDNEVIIDSMEYAGQRSMVFTVSKNNTTVIWLYDFDRVESEKGAGDDL